MNAKAWNYFYEEFETTSYLIDSEWDFPSEKCDVAEWIADNECKLAEIMVQVHDAAEANVHYARNVNCPWTWSLEDEDGDEVDESFIYFDAENHVFAINTDDEEGEWQYRLCARNVFNDDHACVDINIEIFE